MRAPGRLRTRAPAGGRRRQPSSVADARPINVANARVSIVGRCPSNWRAWLRAVENEARSFQAGLTINNARERARRVCATVTIASSSHDAAAKQRCRRRHGFILDYSLSRHTSKCNCRLSLSSILSLRGPLWCRLQDVVSEFRSLCLAGKLFWQVPIAAQVICQ